MKSNLFKRICFPSSLCPLCNDQEESVEQLILRYPWMEVVWYDEPLYLRIGGALTYFLDAWLLEVGRAVVGNAKEKAKFLSPVILTCWRIWKSRCKAIFDQCTHSPPATIFAISS